MKIFIFSRKKEEILMKATNIALLIDSDNFSHNYLEILIDKLKKFGNITYKRIYGDLTASNAHGWKPLLSKFAIERMHNRARDGKNSTDTAMAILYAKKVDCICLATSDSDFTELAMRFKGEKRVVIGAGEQKTPKSFVKVCDEFLFMDALPASVNALKLKDKHK
jgi:predicted nuclease of predicted toxin-antitoxin system